jgi:hypothetical protein
VSEKNKTQKQLYRTEPQKSFPHAQKPTAMARNTRSAFCGVRIVGRPGNFGFRRVMADGKERAPVNRMAYRHPVDSSPFGSGRAR